MTKHSITAPMTLAGLVCMTIGVANAQPAPEAPPAPQAPETMQPPPPRENGNQPGRPGMRQRGPQGRPGMGGPMGGPGGPMGMMPGMPGMGQMQMEDATYLGVEVSPVEPAMKAQLKLTQTDSGLLVNFVADDSPAKTAGLKQYDVLTKLDDQILFNPPQLQSLVRIHKAGDEVKLTYIREGQTQAATAKLETKQQMVPMFGGSANPFGPSPEQMAQIMAQAQAAQAAAMAHGQAAQAGAMTAAQAMENAMAASRTITYETDDMSLTVRPENGKPVLIAKDKSGKELFNGPIETPQQREAVPENVRKGLDKVAVNYLVTSLSRPGWPMGMGFGPGPGMHGMGGPRGGGAWGAPASRPQAGE